MLAAGLISKETGVTLTWALARGRNHPLHPSARILKVYTEASIEFSLLSFKMVSTSPFSLETTPGTSFSGGNDGRTHILRTSERVLLLLLLLSRFSRVRLRATP